MGNAKSANPHHGCANVSCLCTRPLFSIFLGNPGPPLVEWRFAGIFTYGPMHSAEIMAPVISAVAMGADFRFRTVRQTVAWLGSRNAFVASKLIINSLQCMTIAVILIVTSWIVLVTIYGFWSSGLPLLGRDVARLALLVIFFTWIWSLVGSGLALLLQSSTISVGVHLE